MKFLANVAITAIAVWVASLLPLGLEVSGGESEWWTRVLVYLGIAAVFVLLNQIVKPVLSVLALPVTILTLGLFSLVISWFILWLTAWISSGLSFMTLTLGGFWQTLLAALVIGITSAIINAIVGTRRD